MISKKGLRVNHAIRIPAVFLIDHENNQVGVIETREAIHQAVEIGLDLVEVSPTSDPPVCRIMDYGKWLYEQKRKTRESHKKTSHSGTLKEIRLRPETDKHDLDIKIAHARKFLEKGHKVQFTMMFRGRQMLHQDMGYEIMKHIAEVVEDIAKVDSTPKMSNRRMILVVQPR